jgi:ribosomal protein L14
MIQPRTILDVADNTGAKRSCAFASGAPIANTPPWATSLSSV